MFAELDQLEMLAQIDDLTGRTRQWMSDPSPWGPIQRSQALLKRVLSRVETLRVRLESPLVVATFGGTGTGKSSLVNALVGEEVTRSGRQRPTTRKPTIITHSKTDPQLLGLPLSECEVVQKDAEILRDIVILDCPDPDTNETETAGSNLARLHALLPYCDVLIYCSTQQKYRSNRVVTELGQAAAGCRLVFVQTHADLDEDIRDDWLKQLRTHYEVPDLFFVDSLKALREQQTGQRPSGEMGRLMELLARQLAASERVRVRRANVVDLLQATLTRCRGQLKDHRKSLQSLEQALETQRDAMSRKMSQRLCEDLMLNRRLWEQRLLTAVTDNWGISPFSSMLRLYNGLGSLITSLTLYRAKTTAQTALLGAIHGARWVESKLRSQDAETALERAGSCGLDDNLLREAELVIEGHVHAAEISPELLRGRTLRDLRLEAAEVESQFLVDVGQRLDGIIRDLAKSSSRFGTRAWYEILFLSYPAFLLYRVGKNFFYEAFIQERAHLSTDFYIPAVVFFVLWTGLLVMLFSHRLRRGLEGRITGLAQELVDVHLAHGLFPQLESACRDAARRADEVDRLLGAASGLREDLAGASRLGAPKLFDAGFKENLIGTPVGQGVP
jgi:GTPase SAR1 family protein